MKLKQGGIEIISLETSDGIKFPLKGAWLDFGFSGFGATPIQWQSQTGYKRNGSRVVDYRLEERSFNVLIGGSEVNANRYEYWQERSDLLNILRPNRGIGFNELRLTITRLDENGNPIKRAIQCVYNGGAEFEDLDSDSNQFRVIAALEFIAHNPLWNNPDTVTLDLEASISPDLVFPITFPIIFGASGSVFDTGVIVYNGSWRAYPTINITGPYESAVISNEGTGASITLGVAIGAGEVRRIVLAEGSFNITDGNGTSVFSELTIGSNLTDFYLYPEGETHMSDNQIITTLIGADSNSSVQITYNDTYYGI